MRRMAILLFLGLALAMPWSAQAQEDPYDAACQADKWGWFWDQLYGSGLGGDSWPTMVTGGTDLDGGGIPDFFDISLVTAAVCPNGSPRDTAWAANHNALVTATGQGPWWGKPVPMAFLATISTDFVNALVTFDASLASAGLTPYVGADGESLAPSGDYDADGQTNAQEYAAAVAAGGTLEEQAFRYAQFAMTAGEDPDPDPQPATFNDACFYDKWQWFWDQYWSISDWTALADLAAGTTDADGAGASDFHELAMVCGGLAMGCTNNGSSFAGNADIEAAFTANHNALVGPTGQGPYWGRPVVLGMLATISQEWINAIKAQYPELAGVTLVPYTGDGGSQPLAPMGDFDGDGYLNLEEYEAASGSGSTEPIFFAQLATSVLGPFWPGNPSLPVAGGVALMLLVSTVGAAGYRIARKKRN